MVRCGAHKKDKAIAQAKISFSTKQDTMDNRSDAPPKDHHSSMVDERLEDNAMTMEQLETRSVSAMSEITDDHTTIVSDCSTTLAENMCNKDRWGEDATITTPLGNRMPPILPEVERAPRGKAQLEAMEYRLSCVAESVASQKVSTKTGGTASTSMTRAPSPPSAWGSHHSSDSRHIVHELKDKASGSSHLGSRSSIHSTKSQPGAFYAERMEPQQLQPVEESTDEDRCSPASLTSVQDTSSSDDKDEEQSELGVVSETEPFCKEEDSIIAISNALLVAEPPDEFKNTQICMAACDGGGGWAACQHLCVEDATFTCQSDTMGKFTTIREYADFMAGFGLSCPNATWTTDEESWNGVTHTATFFCTYYGQHTVSVEGYGPTVPTLKKAVSHYCCKVTTDPARGNKVVNITKVWNDIWMLRELGWLAEAIPEASHEDIKTVNTMEQADDDTSASTAPGSPENAKKRKGTWKKKLAKFLLFKNNVHR